MIAQCTVRCRNTVCEQVSNVEVNQSVSLVGIRFLPPLTCPKCNSENMQVIEIRLKENIK
jgi:hypothetical protein